MDAYEINTAQRVNAFLAQAAHESMGFTILRENMNYGIDALMRVFPTHFDTATAIQYAHQPQRIANRVYADRFGNGDEASGDGWRYRGGGIGQITFRDNYRRLGEKLGVDLEGSPEQIEDYKVAANAFGAFWKDTGCNLLADAGDFYAITKKVNGGDAGYSDRLARWQAAQGVTA